MNAFQNDKRGLANQEHEIKVLVAMLRRDEVTRQGFVNAMRTAGAFEAEIIDALSAETDREAAI